ncbi:aldehyde dehydrogenase family protein [Celeribacter indicus]|uniref:Aldehyde dehydrogenase n=1 Tax=Celeribacter indicus TaxID=1208324 RepID=A0A0B5DPE2_9RHOB|nr:aldehyde dehydrogenase family protein [Celeribacter indicus]AJE45049.1 aldehyde dehydrogenase [Celeribacter indicus]SDX42110.1 Acyl-CoA reductase [Celeribacter indicus]
MTYSLLIGGNLVAGARSLPVINPATGEAFDHAPLASRAQLDHAVAAAEHAFAGWAATPVAERKARLTAIAEAITANAAPLAELLTREQGKPLAQARRELGAMAGFFRYVTTLDLPEKRYTDADGRDLSVQRRPLGVVATIIPWNFPLMTIAFKVPFALLAGNTVLIKPSPTTPLSTLKFGEIIADLVPPGVVNIVTDDNDLGDAISSHPGIRKVSFTGSTATGRKVMASAAGTLKRLTLELGGNDAAIVLDDVDVEAVVPALFRAAFLNSGQVCLAVKRLYVQEGAYDRITSGLARLAEAAKVGDGLEEDVDFGPVQNRMQFEKLKDLLNEARGQGTILAGGRLGNGPGYFIPPTIVGDMREGCRLVDEEQFGPILPVIRFADPEEVLARSGQTDFGLGASVWSGDAARARTLAERIEAGTVWINKHADLAPHIPFGGAKQSGIGVEFGEEGLVEFTQIRVISA